VYVEEDDEVGVTVTWLGSDCCLLPPVGGIVNFCFSLLVGWLFHSFMCDARCDVQHLCEMSLLRSRSNFKVYLFHA